MSIVIVFFFLGGLIFVGPFWLILKLKDKLKRRLSKKYTPKKASKFKCLDGHVVRSKGELIIDNHLHRLGIKHEYEKTIEVRGKPIKYDWYLPDDEIYIEYWGYHGKDYMERKNEKIDLYDKGKLNLISIEDVMLEDLYSNLENCLGNYINLSKATSNGKKFCPNCGEVLDDRFGVF